MNVVYLLIPLGLVLVGFGLWAFFWAVGSGQFDDLDSPGWSILSDDDGSAGSADADRPTGSPGQEHDAR